MTKIKTLPIGVAVMELRGSILDTQNSLASNNMVEIRGRRRELMDSIESYKLADESEKGLSLLFGEWRSIASSDLTTACKLLEIATVRLSSSLQLF